MTAQILRPYQRAAVDAAFDGWGRGPRSLAETLPTGEGKSTIITGVIERWLPDNAGRRVLVVAHRKELIGQVKARMALNLPDVPVGIIAATRNQTLAPVLVGMIQTLARERRRAMLRNVGLIIIDECHRSAAASYRALLDGWPDALVLGVTATLSRSDDLALGDVFQDVVYRRTFGMAMRGEGNGGRPTLVRPIGVRVTVDDLDLRKIKVSRGDYQDGALGQALSDSMAPQMIAKAYREQCPDRQGISFAPTVDSARVIGEALTAEGLSAELVHGGTPDAERLAILDRYRAGKTQILTNCGVFIEGTDLPNTGVVVIASQTKHSGRWIQMVGRGARLYCPVHVENPGSPGFACCDQMKEDFYVLDVAGASRLHSLEARVELFGVEAAERIEAEDVEPVEVLDELEFETGSDLELDFDRDGVGRGADGKLIFTIVDLFAGSETAWSRTPRGIWYFPGKDRFIAILPADPARGGGHDVVTVQRWGAGCDPIALNVAGIAESMRIGESVIEAVDRKISRRHEGGRGLLPTERTLAYAARLGLDVRPGAGAHEVSEMITAVEAQRRIDDRLLPQLPWLTYA